MMPLTSLARNCGCALIAVLFGAAGPVMAQAPGAQGAGTKAAAPFPTGPGSLSGIWIKSNDRSGSAAPSADPDELKGVLLTADGTPIPFQPWSQKVVDKRIKDAEAGHLFANTQTQCLLPGVPEMMLENGPLEFVETPTQFIVLRQEFTFFRIVHMNAEHQKDFDPTYLGDSIGHWEGDTLVVDTVGQNDKTTIRGYIPHSEDMRVVERFHRTGPDTLDIDVTIDDPKTFTRPWKMVGHLRRQRYDLSEFLCESNRNVPDKNNELIFAPLK